METYFVLGKQGETNSPFVRQPSQNNSLAAVVYTMVQARRKQTIKRGNNPCTYLKNLMNILEVQSISKFTKFNYSTQSQN